VIVIDYNSKELEEIHSFGRAGSSGRFLSISTATIISAFSITTANYIYGGVSPYRRNNYFLEQFGMHICNSIWIVGVFLHKFAQLFSQ
jgi:hypothetical protein